MCLTIKLESNINWPQTLLLVKSDANLQFESVLETPNVI